MLARRGFFHVENIFGRQRRHRALQPAAIERVIGIGSKYTPPCYSLFLTVGHSKRCHPFYSAKNAEILLYLINFLVFKKFFVDRLVSIGQAIFRKQQR